MQSALPWLLAAASIAVGTTACAQVAASPVVAVVRVAKPWYASRATVTTRMQETMPQYAALPGLAFKAFSFEKISSDYGGLYYWRDGAAARTWFDAAWHERVRRERGVDGSVTLFEAPLSIDNVPGGTRRFVQQATAPAASISTLDPLAAAAPPVAPVAPVATLVLINAPAGTTRQRLLEEFGKAVPAHRAIPGLLRKHFLIGDGGAVFGGLYLWRDEASARAWLGPAWQQRVRDSYGQAARIDWFDTPILLPSQDAANAPAASAMMVAPAP